MWSISRARFGNSVGRRSCLSLAISNHFPAGRAARILRCALPFACRPHLGSTGSHPFRPELIEFVIVLLCMEIVGTNERTTDFRRFRSKHTRSHFLSRAQQAGNERHLWSL